MDTIVNEVVTAPAHTRLSLNGIPVVPLFRTEHLVQLTKNLGDFSTPLIGSPDRVHNIRLSLEAINNTIVMPGEVFSFNGVVGERTPERGYRNAPIILGEAVVPGVGGGVCQTSTTLYNAGAPGGAGDRGTPHSLHCPELHQAWHGCRGGLAVHRFQVQKRFGLARDCQS